SSASTLLMFLFSIYCYGHHRRLPSFPTHALPIFIVQLGLFLGLKTLTQLLGRNRRLKRNRIDFDKVFTECGLDLSREVILHKVLDRKSTRLNSSHVKISYAVFCLKKKRTS